VEKKSQAVYEFRRDVHNLKNKRAPSVERTTVEICKNAGPALEIRVQNLIKTVWKKEITDKD
jgi:hypothetical protein